MIGNTQIIDNIFKYDIPLKNYTSFKIGGVAEILAEPGDVSELREILKFCKDEKKKIYILGNGSNVLINDDGIQGVVIRVGGGNFKKIRKEGHHVYSQAGANLSLLIRKTASWGLGGLETLVGIPGTVGGAVVMNAGGKYGNISDTLKCITTMDYDGEINKYNREDIGFTYRGSELKNQIIIEAEFVLKDSKKEDVFERMDKMYKEKMESQPLHLNTMGCIFKNTEEYKAAELIDKAGLKGLKVGGAVVSDLHANFIVNSGTASEDDIQNLIGIVTEEVKKQFKVTLNPEIHYW